MKAIVTSTKAETVDAKKLAEVPSQVTAREGTE
jgi:hypothetical protein